MREVVLAAAVCALAATPAAAELHLYVDSAPNLWWSPNWGSWWDQVKPDVAAGSFVNMRSGHLGTPGVLNAYPYDEIVYSMGDQGYRLHWIYWLPGQTTAELEGRLQVRYVIDWYGTSWVFDRDTYRWTDDLQKGWTAPCGWEGYDNGVIGSFHWAWSAIDDDAPPYDTGGSLDDEVDQADIDALRDRILCHQAFARGEVRLWDDDAGDWGPAAGLTVSIVPVPAAVLLGMLGFGAAGLKLRRYV